MMNQPCLYNISAGKTATQSSTAKISAPGYATLALCDDAKRDFAFHTDLEENPWWMVDLGGQYPLSSIVVGNRRKTCQERAGALCVEVSSDAENWQTIHRGWMFGEGDLVFPIQGRLSARCVRLSLQETNYLHLTKVEIWGLSQEATRESEEDRESQPAAPASACLCVLDGEGLENISIAQHVQRTADALTIDLEDIYAVE
jgi:hypothetical protein